MIAETPRATIVLVEDEAILALDLQCTLRDFGYEVAGWATSGEQALSLVHAKHPDLILMDISLAGEMDGVRVAQEIHEHFGIPVIFLTANADSLTLSRAKAAQPAAFLVKPFKRQELKTNIEVTLHRHRSEENTRQLVQRSSDGIVLTDDQGIVVEWNSAAAAITELGRSEVLGRPLWEVAFSLCSPGHMDTEQQLRKLVIDFLNGCYADACNDLHTVQISTASGSGRHLQASLFRVGTGRGQGIGSIFRDITQQDLLAEQQVLLAVGQEKLRIMADFLGAVAHEIRTPLSVINSGVYLIEKRGEGCAAISEQTQVIRQQVRYVSGLVDKIMKMTQLEGAVELNYRSINPHSLVENLLELVSSRAAAIGLVLERELEDNLGELQVDPDELQLALQNVLENALDCTPAGGRITFRARQTGGFTEFEIADTGIGISERDLPHIFDCLYRVDPARTIRKAGLGLTIARLIVEAHMGKIEVESRLGEGSTFRILIPNSQVPTVPAFPRAMVSSFGSDADSGQALVEDASSGNTPEIKQRPPVYVAAQGAAAMS